LLLTFVYFGFINLQAVGAWQPPQLVGIAKLFVVVAGCLKSDQKEPTLGFPRV
jgi:hypothetical protein